MKLTEIAPPPVFSANRLIYFDFIRGIAIIFVVGIHTITSVNFNTVLGNIDVLIRQIIGSAVPIFLAISGYFLAKKRIESFSGYLHFFYSRLKKIYVPTMIYSLPWVILSIKAGVNPLNTILLALICGMSICYFIALILQYYALLPVYQKCGNTGLIVSAIISLFCSGVICYLLDIRDVHIPLIAYAGPFPVWGVFFALGMYMRLKKPNIRIKTFIVLIILALILSCFESKFLCSFHGKGLGMKPSAFIYSALLIMFLFSEKVKSSFKETRFSKLIIRIGNDSFAIYLTHMLVLNIAIKFFPGWDGLNWYVHWFALFIIDWALVGAMKIVVPERFRKYLALF